MNYPLFDNIAELLYSAIMKEKTPQAKLRETIRRKLEECPNPQSITYREQIADELVKSTLSGLQTGEKDAVKIAIALLETLEGKPPQELQVAVDRPIVLPLELMELKD